MALPLTDAEFAAILADGKKCIPNDITWTEDEDPSPAWEFRANVESGQGWPLIVRSQGALQSGR